jgi:hypothetical protein
LGNIDPGLNCKYHVFFKLRISFIRGAQRRGLMDGKAHTVSKAVAEILIQAFFL